MRRSTKDRIVDAAVELFNESSAGAVTTNHIAAHLGISPGNLYYHFANKEEIIRAAFARMNEEADAVWSLPGGAASGEGSGKGPVVDPLAMQRMVVGNLQLYGRYVFFARELPALLRADPELRARYGEISERRIGQLESVIAPLIDAGLLTNVGDEEDVRALVETAWMIGMACVPYSDALHPPAKSQRGRNEQLHAALEHGALLVINLFRPYMDPLAYTALVVLVRNELHHGAGAGDKGASSGRAV